MASRYDQKYVAGNSSFQEEIRKIDFSFLSNVRNKIILEIGCGNGLFLKRLIDNLDNSNRIFRIDYSLRMLKIAKNQKITNLLNADASCLPFKTKSLDYIFLVNTFSSLPKPLLLHILKEIERVLKLESFFTFDFKNKLNPIVILRIMLFKMKEQIFNTYSPGEIKRLFKQQMKLKIVSEKSVYKTLGLFMNNFCPSISYCCVNKENLDKLSTLYQYE